MTVPLPELLTLDRIPIQLLELKTFQMHPAEVVTVTVLVVRVGPEAPFVGVKA